MKQKYIFEWLNGSAGKNESGKAENYPQGFAVNLHKLAGVFLTLGMSVMLGSNVVWAFPRYGRSNPYVTIFSGPIYGPSRTVDGTVSGTLRSAIKYGWDFSAIAQDLQQFGLTETLSRQDDSEGNTILYTVFIPTNEAWQTLDPAIRANPETLEKILRYHIVPGAVTETQLESGEIQTLSGATLTIQANASGDRFFLNQDVEITSSLRTQNGMIVFVNQPLVPWQN